MHKTPQRTNDKSGITATKKTKKHSHRAGVVRHEGAGKTTEVCPVSQKSLNTQDDLIFSSM